MDGRQRAASISKVSRNFAKISYIEYAPYDGLLRISQRDSCGSLDVCVFDLDIWE